MASNIKDINIRLQTARRLMHNLIVKQQKRAYDNETEESARAYQEYYHAFMKFDKLSDYIYWTEDEIRTAFPSSSEDDIKILAKDNNVKEVYNQGHFTEYEIQRLLDAKRASIITNYVEKNEYYRMLIGLPTLEEMNSRDFVYHEGTPLHELDYTTKLRLRRNGTFDQYFNDTQKQYIRFIGREIDLITARESEEFELLSNSKDRADHEMYAICYNKEREIWMRTFYNEYLMWNTYF